MSDAARVVLRHFRQQVLCSLNPLNYQAFPFSPEQAVQHVRSTVVRFPFTDFLAKCRSNSTNAPTSIPAAFRLDLRRESEGDARQIESPYAFHATVTPSPLIVMPRSMISCHLGSAGGCCRQWT